MATVEEMLKREALPLASREAIRMRAFRDFLECLVNRPGGQDVWKIVGGTVREFSEELQIPRFAVELLVCPWVEDNITFPFIDELQEWMAEHEIQRSDIVKGYVTKKRKKGV